MFKMKGIYNYKWLNSQVVSMGGKEEEIHTPLVLVLTHKGLLVVLSQTIINLIKF
jgi:hypothetical protein